MYGEAENKARSWFLLKDLFTRIKKMIINCTVKKTMPKIDILFGTPRDPTFYGD